jgi:hypothetical protein
LRRERLPRGLLAALIAAAAIGGCGKSAGTGSEPQAQGAHRSTAQAETAAERATYTSHAERICQGSVREARGLRVSLPNAISHSFSAEEGITKGLVEPGIEILSRESRQLRGLEPRPASASLERFLGLFEPIVTLSQQRLKAGEDHNLQRGHQLELLIAGLSHEQTDIAKRLGFKRCGIGFFEALGGSE